MSTTTTKPSAGVTPKWNDLLEIDGLFSDQEKLLRDTVRRWVRERIAPHLADWFERGYFDIAVAKELGELGLLGMHLEGYGCAGASAVDYGLACLELEAGDSGLRSFVSVQGSLAMFPIHAFGSADQKNEWLPAMAKGEKIGCFGLTEADYGSNPSGMRTSARRDGSDWIIDGSKMWITNGGVADVAIIWAQTDHGIRGFIVPTDTQGFSTNDIHRKISLRASVTSELLLQGCRVPAAAMLPDAKGLRGPLSCLNEARYGILWGAIGAARTCYETAVEYSKTRVVFDKPIGGFQLTQRKLVGMALELNKALLVALQVGRNKDAGRSSPQQISFGKLNNVRAAIDIAREARAILGANGITLEYPVIRHMNNLESVLTYEGTEEIHTLVLGEAITGIAAYK